MKLTRTDVVFSRTTMVLFIVRKTKVLGMTWKSTKITVGIYKKYWWKNQGQGPTPCPRGWGRASCPVGPLVLLRPQLQLYIFVFGEKKSYRRIHRVLQYEVASKPYTLSGGLIWSPFGAPERGICCHHYYVLSLRWFSLKRKGWCSNSSVSISLSFWEPRYQSSRRLLKSPTHLHKQTRTRN